MRNSVWVTLLAVFMVIGFSAGSGMVALDSPSAYAKGGESKDDKSKESKAEDKTSKDDKSSDTKKVNLCHVPSGNPAAKHTITVAESAVAAHLKHGDTLGACGFSCICPAGVSSCICPDGSAGDAGAAASVLPASQRKISGQ